MSTGGEIKILSVLTHFETVPMKFAIRREEMKAPRWKAPNYFRALSSRLSPVKIAKIEKKNRVVLKIGRIVERNVLNNILKAPAGRR